MTLNVVVSVLLGPLVRLDGMTELRGARLISDEGAYLRAGRVTRRLTLRSPAPRRRRLRLRVIGHGVRYFHPG